MDQLKFNSITHEQKTNDHSYNFLILNIATHLNNKM